MSKLVKCYRVVYWDKKGKRHYSKYFETYSEALRWAIFQKSEAYNVQTCWVEVEAKEAKE